MKLTNQQYNMKHIFFTMLVLLGITYHANAQQAAPATKPPYNFSLDDCINYAYEHQDTVVNARLDVKSAEYKVRETTGIGLPQINGAVNFQDYLKIPTVLFPNFVTPAVYDVLIKQKVKDGTGNTITTTPAGAGGYQSVSLNQKYNSNIGITLNQLLFDGSYLVGLKASRTYKELSERSYVRSRIEAKVNVTKAYYQVLVSNERLKLLDADLEQLKQLNDQTIALNKQGFVEKIDVDRIKVQYNNLLTVKENTIRLLVLNYQLLKFQMGMPVNDEITLTDKLENIKLELDASPSTDTSFYHNRVEYNLGETALKLNQLDLQLKKSKYLPSLAAVASSAFQFQNNSFGSLYSRSYPSTYIGIGLNVPIFSGGQRSNQVKQSQIAVLKSQNDLFNLKNALTLQANAAQITYINGLRSLDNQKQNQQLAQEVLRVSKIKYQQGVGSSIEITQAQTAMEDADNKYIQSLYDVLVSKVDLDKAYGRIK